MDKNVGYLNPTGALAEDLKALGYTQPGWYFWDETQAYLDRMARGPYTTEAEAVQALRNYASSLG